MFTKTQSAESFKKKSNDILGVFTKTKQQLADLVNEQVGYLTSVKDQIKSLEAEKDTVEADIKENQAVITKISDFLK